MITYRQASIEDVHDLTPRLRASDKEECLHYAGPHYESSLVESVVACGDRAEAALDPDGKVIAILGCSSEHKYPFIGVPFMVGSDDIEKYPKHALTDARARTKVWAEEFPLLLNMVYAENTQTIKWLKRVGYTIGFLHNWGYSKAPFYNFYKGDITLCVP